MNSEHIRQNLESVQSQLNSMLEDFKEYYILTNKEPDNEEYSRYYQSISTNIEQLKNRLFSMKNTIEKNTNVLTSDLSKINGRINNAREKNNNLRNGVHYTRDEYNTSEEMIENYVDIYNLMYMKNFSLFIGILGLGLFMSKHFSKQQ
jgi:chromosome segregation ATPase